MVSRGTLSTLVAIWPEIQAYLDADLKKVQERLVQAVGVDEIRTLQGRGKALMALANLPADLSREIVDAEETDRLETLQRMTQSDPGLRPA